MLNDIEQVLYSEEEIDLKVRELGAKITEDYKGKELLVIGILKGAVTFMSELLKRIELPVKIDFMDVSSYGSGTNTTGEVRILKDLESTVEGKDLLIVEDIIDTGLTLSYLTKNLENRGAKSVTIVTLLNKPSRRKREVNVKYIGYDIEDLFVVGYGLDFAEKYRNLPFVGTIKEELYKNWNIVHGLMLWYNILYM